MSDEKKFFESMESDILNANIPEEEKSKREYSDRKDKKGILDKFGEVVSDIGSAIYNTGKAVVETVYNIVSSIGSFFGF